MGCRLLYDGDYGGAVLFCSTTDWAFGPVFQDADDHDGQERAHAFVRWLRNTAPWASYEREPLETGRHDPRELTARGLERAYGDWLAQEADQWAREDAAVCAEED